MKTAEELKGLRKDTNLLERAMLLEEFKVYADVLMERGLNGTRYEVEKSLRFELKLQDGYCQISEYEDGKWVFRSSPKVDWLEIDRLYLLVDGLRQQTRQIFQTRYRRIDEALAAVESAALACKEIF